MPPSSSVSAQAVESYLIPGRTNANASSCRILCLMSRDESQRWLQIMLASKNPQKSVLPATAHINELLDEALEETFPASDPIAINIEIKSPGTEQRQHKGFILRPEAQARRRGRG
jgi:hypothetical protein